MEALEHLKDPRASCNSLEHIEATSRKSTAPRGTPTPLGKTRALEQLEAPLGFPVVPQLSTVSLC